MLCLGGEVDDVDVDFDVDCDVQMRWCPGGKGNQTAGSVFLRRALGGLTETPIDSVEMWKHSYRKTRAMERNMEGWRAWSRQYRHTDTRLT